MYELHYQLLRDRFRSSKAVNEPSYIALRVFIHFREVMSKNCSHKMLHRIDPMLQIELAFSSCSFKYCYCYTFNAAAFYAIKLLLKSTTVYVRPSQDDKLKAGLLQQYICKDISRLYRGAAIVYRRVLILY